MSVQDEITRIQNGKNDLLDAISEYGVEVASDTPIEQTGDKVRQIGEKFYTKTESDELFATKTEAKEIVTVDIVNELIIPQNNEYFLELSRRMALGEIAVLGILENDKAIVQGVSYDEENSFAAWSVGSYVWNLADDGGLSSAKSVVFGIYNRDGIIQYGFGNYFLSDFITEYNADNRYARRNEVYSKTESDNRYASGKELYDNYATKNEVKAEIAKVVNSAPETLDTLGKVAQAIKQNESTVQALNSAIGNKANKSEVYTRTASDEKFATKTEIENSVKYGDIIQNTNPFGGKKLYINKIDDCFYVLHKRANVTAKLYLKSDNSFVREYDVLTEVSQLYDGNYETDLEIPAGHYAVVDMLFDNYWDIFGGYPYGDIIISNYDIYKTESITVKVSKIKNPTEENWANDTDTPYLPVKDFVNNNKNQFIKIASNNAIVYPVHAIRMTVVAPDNQMSTVTTVEMSLLRPSPTVNPFINKYYNEKLFYPLTAPEFIGKLTGTADKAISDGNGNNIANTYAKKQDIPAIPEMSEIVEFYDENPFVKETNLTFLYKSKNLLNVGERTKAKAGESNNGTARNFDENTYCVGLASSNWWGEWNVTSYSVENNSVKLTIKNMGYGIAFPIKCQSLTTYIFSCNNNSGQVRVAYYRNDGSHIKWIELYKFQEAEFTTPEDCYWLTICFVPTTLDVEAVFTDISLKKKSTDTKMRMIFTSRDFGRKLINGETVTNSAGVSITLNENDIVAVPDDELERVYPIGTIYMADNEGNNPQNWANTSWTWELISNANGIYSWKRTA